MIIAGDEKGTLHVYSENMEHITSHFLHHQSIYALDSCKDYIATISSDGQGILSDFKEFDPISLIGDNSEGLKSVDICPFDTSKLLTSGKEGTIALFDIRVKPAKSFGVDHFYAIKDFRNGPAGPKAIKYCVGKCAWLTEYHFASFGLSDNSLKLFDIRNSKSYCAQNTLNGSIKDMVKTDGSLCALNDAGNILELNNWDLNVCNIYKTALKVNQYSSLAYQSCTSTLAIGACSGRINYLSFSPITPNKLKNRRIIKDYKMSQDTYSDPILYMTEVSHSEINAIKFLNTPFSVISGDDKGILRTWETESPGNDIDTAVLVPGLCLSELQRLRVNPLYDSKLKKYARETIHVSMDPKQFKDCEQQTLKSEYKRIDVQPTKSANLLTPMKKKRKTMDSFKAPLVPVGMLTTLDKVKSPTNRPQVQSILSPFRDGMVIDENIAPQRKPRKSKINMNSLFNYGFKQE